MDEASRASDNPAPPWAPPAAPATPAAAEESSSLPPHLGWGSERLSEALRRARQRQKKAAQAAEAESLTWLRTPLRRRNRPKSPPGRDSRPSQTRSNCTRTSAWPYDGRLWLRSAGKGPEGKPMPIARSTMEEISGVSRRSQRAYEERAGVEVQHNFAVGEEAEAAVAQERAWQEGTVFPLKDYDGQQGKKGKTYLAWQLPNSYAGGHEQRPKGRQKRINHRLADLFMKGMTGNGEDGVDPRTGARKCARNGSRYDVRYYADGKRAVRGYNRRPQEDAYWPGARASRGDFCVWQVLLGGTWQ